MYVSDTMKAINGCHFDAKYYVIPLMCMLSALSQIADFGMFRGLSEDSIYYMAESAKFPIRWTAPEVSKLSS